MHILIKVIILMFAFAVIMPVLLSIIVVLYAVLMRVFIKHFEKIFCAVSKNRKGENDG